MRIIVIGGGHFGLYLAWYFARKNIEVHLFEKEDEFMLRASYHNQARVHNGYHYPRSVLTAIRSRVSFPRFVKEFPNCIKSDFEKYYMVGQPLGKVTAYQFRRFCERIGADISSAPDSITKLVNPQYIEAVFTTKEYAFDAIKLRQALLERLHDLPVHLHLSTEVKKVESIDGELLVHFYDKTSESNDCLRASHVFNCTYSRINYLLHESGLELIPLKHEMTEMCLVDVPPEIKNMGITVMCGPFFSVMPFPAVTHNSQFVHSFSHVRYTPHYEWFDAPDKPYVDAHVRFTNDAKYSAWEYMRKDAQRYIPCLSDCNYLDSLWEVKTVLPRSEVDDSRPILCRFNHGLQGFHSVMGGKIDNVYDAVEAINDELGI